MKYILKSQKIILGLFLIVGFSACTKDFEKLNENPNNPINVPAINIFTNTIQSSVDRQLGGWIQHTYLGVWSQQWCKIQYIDEDRYMPRDMSAEFQNPYVTDIKNLAIVIDKATKENNDRLLGAAKIMRAWVYMYITDVWGDIPYTEAMQGFVSGGTLNPKYDTQASIYDDLLVQLEEANVLLTGLEEEPITFGSGDILYGGNPDLWRKFANSLKLRLLNRAAGTPWSFTYNMAGGTQVTTTAGAVALSTADAQIGALLADPAKYPVFSSNDDNAALSYPGLPYRNPIFNTLYARQDQAISETMVEWLSARADPRIHIYAQPTPNSITGDKKPPFDSLKYLGFQNGRKITAANFPSISLLGTPVAYAETAPTYLLCYDEIEFIKAEYYKRTGNDALAQTAYGNGIKASMGRWGLSDGGTVMPSWGTKAVATGDLGFAVNLVSYIAGPAVAWGGTDAHKYQLICEQRWAAMFGQGVQAYCEIRRTGFPARIFEYELEGAYYPDLGLPIRVQYALSEDTYNTNAVSKARTDQSIELTNEGMFSRTGITSQMWWHTRKNPIPTVIDVH